MAGGGCQPRRKRRRTESQSSIEKTFFYEPEVANAIVEKANGRTLHPTTSDDTSIDEAVVSDTFTLGSDCTGLGSEALALKLCGISPLVLWGSETQAIVRRMHQASHQSSAMTMHKDATTNVPRPPVDMYVAGFPCQSFSGAGKRQGVNDLRGCVIYHVLSRVRSLRPRLVVLENVRGLVDQHRGVFSQVLAILSSLGYHVTWKLVNTAQHGLPQSRPRVYVVAMRSCTRPYKWPKVLHQYVGLDRVLDNMPSKMPPEMNPTARQNLEITRQKLKKKGVDGSRAPVMVDIQASRRFATCAVNKSPCITVARASHGGYYILNQMRMTSLRELGRLQGFPTWFIANLERHEFPKKEIGAAIGNAMSINILCRILPRAAHAAGLIRNVPEDRWKHFKKPKGEFRLPDHLFPAPP